MNDMLYALKVLVFLLLTMPLFSTVAAMPTVTSVTAQQRYPWNGLVDIAVTFNGEQSEVAKANCIFAATNSATKAALAIAHITPQGDATGSGSTWTRRFIWDTNADVGEVKIDDVELFADVEVVAEEPEDLGGVQLWEGGPYWAECNVGASKPEEYGLYFWWGDTVGHNGDWYFSFIDCPTCYKSITELRSLGYIDSKGNLAPAHDAARAHWGSPWRMPTKAECSALISNCDSQWTTRNGVNGYLVKGRGAYSSKSFFLPAAGEWNYSSHSYLGLACFYWSSTPNDAASGLAWSYRIAATTSAGRYLGLSVRPVRGFAK